MEKKNGPAATPAADADRLAVARAIAELDKKLKSLEAALGLTAQEAAATDDKPEPKK